MSESSERIPFKVTKEKIEETRKRGLKDGFRKFRFELTAVHAELRFIARALFRELYFYISVSSLLIIVIAALLIILPIALLILFIIPFLLQYVLVPVLDSIFQSDFSKIYLDYKILVVDTVLGSDTKQGLIRDNRVVFGALAGAIGLLIRIVLQPEFEKFRNKVNFHKSDMTYVFGTTPYAERLVHAMVHRFGYEEKLCLIADNDYLWVQGIKIFIPTYVVSNPQEFSKDTFYSALGFKNAKMVFVLTDNSALNQDIITKVREHSASVPIYLLKQHAPTYLLEFENVLDLKEQNIFLIDDLTASLDELLISMALDIKFPTCYEMPVPKTHVGVPAIKLKDDVGGLEVLRIKRGDQWLHPTETLQKGDRLLVYVMNEFDLKRTNRIVTELTLKKKTSKNKKKKKKKQKKDEKESKLRSETKEEVIETAKPEIATPVEHA